MVYTFRAVLSGSGKVAFLLTLCLLMVACQLVQPAAPQPSVTITQGGRLNLSDCIKRREQTVAQTSLHWIIDEIVLYGSEQEIQELLSAFSDVIEPDPLMTCQLSELFDLADEEAARRFAGYLVTNQEGEPVSEEERQQRIQFGALPDIVGRWQEPGLEQLQDLTLQVFRVRVQDDADLVALVSRLNSEAQERDYYVFADPNYLIGVSGSSLCGNPNSVGASPNSVGASPFELTFSPNSVGASPVFGLASIPDTARVAPVLSQLAFADASVTRDDLREFSKSEEIRVAIFDTMPFTQALAGASSALVTMTWPVSSNAPDVLSMNVWGSSSPILPAVNIAPEQGSNDHGLFVAGLVHALAPAAQIDLIRTLNEAGCGDLATIAANLYMYIDSFGDEEGMTMANVVLNLSLGVHAPHNTSEILDQLNLLVNPIQQAYNRGAMIVAAAGNDSGEVSAGNDLWPTHRPAAYGVGSQDPVLGVSASNAADERACFSNGGDLAAFGGNGIAATLTITSTPQTFQCAPASQHCTDYACEWGLVSTVTPATSPTGFAFWSGTSFATPIVSGLAALRWGREPELSQNDVANQLKACAEEAPSESALGKGVLHLGCIVEQIGALP